MTKPSIRRRAAVLGAAGLVLAALSACEGTRHPQDLACDYVVTRCQTVCDTWCDDFGCYPDCWDQCWDDCVVLPPSAVPIADGGEAGADAAPPPPPGVLCSACSANDQCGSGGLCIVRGGASDAGRDSSAEAGADAGASASASGFCSIPCKAPSDCPQGFACAGFSSGSQCLPTSPDACR